MLRCLITIICLCNWVNSNVIVVNYNNSEIQESLYTLDRSLLTQSFVRIFSKITAKNLRDSTAGCSAKLKSLRDNLGSPDKALQQESIAFLDAFGKPEMGVSQGNLLMIGNYDMCPDIKNSDENQYTYCYIGAPSRESALIRLDWSGCLPPECVPDHNNLDTWAASVLSDQALILVNSTLKLENEHIECEKDMVYDTGAYVGTVLLVIISVLVLLGTLLVLFQPAMDSLRGSHTNDNSFTKFLKCFDLQKSFESLTNTTTKPGQILCLNGIRVLSINWVVLGHCYLVFVSLAADKLWLFKTMIHRRNNPIVFNGYPSVDTFFTLSGFLVSYLLLKQLAKGATSWQHWFAYYFHRYVRLTPPYLIVILLEGFLLRQWVKGPFVVGLEGFHKTCKEYWWANLLYINNLVPWKGDKICNTESWYLSNDMQFYILAPIFIYLLFRSPMLGVMWNLLTMAVSVIVACVITYKYKLGPSGYASLNRDDWWLLYIRPWIRITPYLIGILGGWFYWKHGKALKDRIQLMSEWRKLVVATPCWIITCVVQWAVVFGMYDNIKLANIERKAPSMVDSVTYQSLARIAWSSCLTLQIFLCQGGLGGFINSILSWKGWLVLSRLTYGVYLLHIGVMTIILAQSRHSFYLHPDYEMSVRYLGALIMSYLAAAILFICLEQPLASLEALSYRKPRSTSPKTEMTEAQKDTPDKELVKENGVTSPDLELADRKKSIEFDLETQFACEKGDELVIENKCSD